MVNFPTDITSCDRKKVSFHWTGPIVYIYSIINFRIRCISEVLLEWKKVFQLHNVVYAKCLQTKILGLARSVNPILFSLSFNSTSINISGSMNAHRRTGRGGRGGLQPPQILGNSDFLGSKRKFGQSHFLKTFPCFFLLV